MWLILPKALTEGKERVCWASCRTSRSVRKQYMSNTYSMVLLIRRSGKVASVISPGMAMALPPAALMSAATRSALAKVQENGWLFTWPQKFLWFDSALHHQHLLASMSVTTTWAPSRAKSSAQVWPIPWLIGKSAAGTKRTSGKENKDLPRTSDNSNFTGQKSLGVVARQMALDGVKTIGSNGHYEEEWRIALESVTVGVTSL